MPEACVDFAATKKPDNVSEERTDASAQFDPISYALERIATSRVMHLVHQNP